MHAFALYQPFLSQYSIDSDERDQQAIKLHNTNTFGHFIK